MHEKLALMASKIQTLEPLEPIRKRPKMYYDLENPNFGTNLIISALKNAIEETNPTSIYIDFLSELAVKIGFNKALGAYVCYGGARSAEKFVSVVLCGKNPDKDYGPDESGYSNYQMPEINAACKEFILTVRNDEGEWQQLFQSCKKITEFKVVGPTKGDFTMFEMELDADFFNKIGCSISIDSKILKEWCYKNKVDFKEML